MEVSTSASHRWNTFEILWLLSFSTIALVLSILWKNTWFDGSVFLSGILCVVLAAKGNIWNYAFGLYNSLAYALVAYKNGLYGEMGLNLLFFVPMGVIGYLMWKPKSAGAYVEMRLLRFRNTLLIALACIIAIGVLGYLLAQISGQNNPYIDATTDVLSIAATILMVYRYREQWLLYLLLNAFTVLLWGIRTSKGSAEGVLMIVMWSAFLVNAIYGYYNWSKGAQHKSSFV
jgi:nicotinamide mononucleotide transporter